MRDAEVGRVLVASLHQAISDILPTRLVFYEDWLKAEGIREGTIGLAAISAVLSFLRREGAAYDAATRCAGEYAATWTVESMRPLRRSLMERAPVGVRRRLVVSAARRLVRDSCQSTSAAAKFGRGTTKVSLRSSIFCTVRDSAPAPLCGFYAALFETVLGRFNLPIEATIVGCRAMGADTCTLSLTDRGAAGR
jgi:hypothetical protein